MALTYNYIVRQSGLRVNAIIGPVASTLQTNYNVSPQTSAQYGSTIFPFTSIQDAVRLAEERIAEVIAETGNQSLRKPLLSVTEPLPTGSTIPGVDENDVKVIGIYGAVLDAEDPTIVCTSAPPQEIRRRLKSSAYWKIPVYLYSINGDTIIHTRPAPGVLIQVCVYNGDAQKTAIEANGPLLLADTLEEAYVSGTVSMLFRDDEFSQQAAQARQAFSETLQGIRSGFTSVSPVSMPGPVLAAQAQ